MGPKILWKPFVITTMNRSSSLTHLNDSISSSIENTISHNPSITNPNAMELLLANFSFEYSLDKALASLYGDSIDVTTTERAEEIFKKPVRIFSFIILIIGVFANSLTIRAIIHIPKPQRTAHLKFIISLACSDILILVAICCGDVIYIVSSLHPDCTNLFRTLLLDVPLLATLLNLLAMALDHYLASFRQLHYRHLMTKSRANYVIVAIWVISASVVLTEILVGLDEQFNTFDSFCMAIVYDEYNIEQVITGTIFIVLLVIIMIYIRLYYHVRRSLPLRPSTRGQSVSPSTKTLVTTMLFIGTFVLFWTPEGIFHIFMNLKSKTDPEYIKRHRETITSVNDVLFLILQLNSLADPIIYAAGLPLVKQGCKAVFCKKVHRAEKLEKCYIQLKHTNYTTLSFGFRSNPQNSLHLTSSLKQ